MKTSLGSATLVFHVQHLLLPRSMMPVWSTLKPAKIPVKRLVPWALLTALQPPLCQKQALTACSKKTRMVTCHWAVHVPCWAIIGSARDIPKRPSASTST